MHIGHLKANTVMQRTLAREPSYLQASHFLGGDINVEQGAP